MSKLLVALVCSFLFCSFPARSQGTIPVPPEYQDLYNSVSANLTSFSTTVQSSWDGTPSGTLHSAQLASANSDLTTSLLNPNYYSMVILSQLNALQALGVNAITFHINFPALFKGYYTDPNEYQSYLNFYTQLVAEIRSRGLKLIIENTIAIPYPGNDSISFQPYYATLDWPTYQAQRASLAADIAQYFKPDYLVLAAEPDTEATNTGQVNAGTVDGSTGMVSGMISAVKARNVSGVQLGAGAGTWNSSFTQFEQSFAALPLDFVDMHVYPINRNYLPNALSGAQLINAAGKQVTMSECWLYKEADSELGIMSYTDIYSRDAFDFWEPLDEQFLQTMLNFGSYQDFTFISPFWSINYFDYLDYPTYGGMDSATIINTEQSIANQAAAIGSFSPTGIAWEQMIVPNLDQTAPAVPAQPTLKGVSQTVANVAWTPSTDNVGVAAYNVYRNGTWIASVNSPQNYIDQTLSPTTTYSYTLTAFDAMGNMSAPSAPLVVTTYGYPDHSSPSIPGRVRVSSMTDISVNLTWNPSTDNVAVTGYEIYRGSTPTTLAPWATTPITSYTDPWAAPLTTYYYAVDAYDAFNNHSGQSNPLKVTTPADLNPPTVPGNFKAVSLTPVTLSWSASTDDYFVSGYKIYRGSSATNLMLLNVTSNLSYVDTQAVSGKTYYYAVASMDVAKNVSAMSPVVMVTAP